MVQSEGLSGSESNACDDGLITGVGRLDIYFIVRLVHIELDGLCRGHETCIELSFEEWSLESVSERQADTLEMLAVSSLNKKVRESEIIRLRQVR